MELSPELLAYLAGAIDADGSIGIRQSTYAVRVRRDARQPMYSERVCFKQVTPQIPALLKATFGGSLMEQSPSVTKGRALHYWEVTNRVAASALTLLLPHLRIKRAQAEACLALRASKDLPQTEQRVLRAAAPSRTGTGVHQIRRRELSPAVLAERERLYVLVKELNRVGL
jgi:hypothetical protein